MGSFKFIIFISIILYNILSSYSEIIGFDCSSNNTIIKKYSLLNVKNCPSYNINKSQELNTEIQLIQIKKFKTIETVSCLISENLLIFRCGYSWQQFQQSGLVSNIIKISYSQCLDIIKLKSYFYRNKVLLSNLKIDHLNTWRGTIFGSIDNNGNCEPGGIFSLDGNNYNRAVVTSEMKILISTDSVSIDIEDGKLLLKSGTRCKFTDYECFDLNYGWTYWTSDKLFDNCGGTTQYDVLYEGSAKKVVSNLNRDNFKRVTFFVNTQDLSFALNIEKQILICNQHAYQTEHPKLMIIEKNEFGFFLKKDKIYSKNIDLFTYMNSKFIHITKDIKIQIEEMYSKIMAQKCETDRIVLNNLLNIAILDSELFAYSIMNGPGYTAIIRGEIIYIVRCTPKYVNLRKSKECYNDLPITHNNKSVFLRPRSRLIVGQGKEIDCHSILHSAFHLQNIWVTNGERTIETNPPLELSPAEPLDWELDIDSKTLTNGIYRLDELDSFSKLLLDPISHKTISENFIRSVEYQENGDTKISLLKALNDEDLKLLHTSYWSSVFHSFFRNVTQIGSVMSFIIGIVLILKFIKTIIEVVISGKLLYNVYGLSWKLFGCFSKSLVVLYNLLKQKKQQKRNVEEELIEFTKREKIIDGYESKQLNISKINKLPDKSDIYLQV